MKPLLTVVIPAHNPDPRRLHETLLGLRSQTLGGDIWDTLLIDNASGHFPDPAWLAERAPEHFKTIREPALGLNAARRRALQEASGELAVLVDDDNVLDSNYLERALALFETRPKVGVAGGRSIPRFNTEPPDWMREFFPLLALRDLGNNEIISSGLRPAGATRNQYPAFAPIGAGMVLRRQAWECWLANPAPGLTDRRGSELSSGGDNDIVLSAMQGGWEVAYFPGLALTHLIPSSRLEPSYLARLNRGVQNSWMQVLTEHDANPWPPLTTQAAAIRKFKTWFTYSAWSSPAARIRWNGARGHFEGRTATAK
jgi:GT2 family glycosyltransferase